jgi:putative Ca2+/H+ antiporter (TMEM165/GDT1 family)
MESFLTSTGLVTLAEIGDKTQLLSLLLAARFRRPWPIIAGILVATLANHAAASGIGNWLTTIASPAALRWGLGLSFLAMAAWMLVPDKAEAAEADRSGGRLGVFGTTLVAFFLAEMGDKTQVATVALAASFGEFTSVVLGTTAGMMLANMPVVLVGNGLSERLPMRLVHGVAAAVFAVIGLLAMFGDAIG